MLKRIPFSADELTVVGIRPPVRLDSLPRKSYNTPVTAKENFLAVLRRELPLWIPCENDSIGMFPGVNPDNHARGQVMEAVTIPPEEITDFHDMFGIEWVYSHQVGGSMVVPGAPALEDANDWEKIIKFPDIEKWDWEAGRKLNEKYVSGIDSLLTITMSTGFFERLISFMDFQNAALAMIDEDQTDAVHALFSALCDLYDKIIGKYKECFNPDVICLHDDWGSQRAPFFSLNTVREMILPYINRISASIHSRDMFFEFHSCGKIELLAPAIVETGADIWTGQPINDKDYFYQNYGDKIILGPEPDVQPDRDMSDEDAVAAAKRFVAKYAPDYEKKPVIANRFLAPDSFIETIYEESRRYFS